MSRAILKTLRQNLILCLSRVLPVKHTYKHNGCAKGRMNVFAVPLRQIVPCRAPFTDAFCCWERPPSFYNPYGCSEFSFRWESKRFLHSITTHYGIRVRGEVILAYSEVTGQLHAAADLPLYSFDSKFGRWLPVSALTWWKRNNSCPCQESNACFPFYSQLPFLLSYNGRPASASWMIMFHINIPLPVSM